MYTRYIIDRDSFASRERLFQSFATLYSKLFLGIPFSFLEELYHAVLVFLRLYFACIRLLPVNNSFRLGAV